MINVGFVFAAAAVLAQRVPSRGQLVGLEICSWFMVCSGYFMPTTPTVFYYALTFFATGMALHSRICAKMTEEEGTGAPNMMKEALNIFFLNMYDRNEQKHQRKMSIIARIVSAAVSFLLADGCMYLVREWIPNDHHVQPGHQVLLQAVAGAMWILYSLDIFYAIGTAQLQILGSTLATEYWHKHPLLSKSLTEFWGVRWNPIVAKLLQDSFYKPLRRLGGHRAVSVFACFTASALLHTIPMYMATGNSRWTTMIFLFFVLHGAALLLELTVKEIGRAHV
jgi:hypothetical protein